MSADLAFKNLGGEKLELEVEGGAVGGEEDGGGDVPSGVGLLKLDQPLVGGYPVARLGIVVEHVHRLGNLHGQLFHGRHHPSQPIGADHDYNNNINK